MPWEISKPFKKLSVMAVAEVFGRVMAVEWSPCVVQNSFAARAQTLCVSGFWVSACLGV